MVSVFSAKRLAEVLFCWQGSGIGWSPPYATKNLEVWPALLGGTRGCYMVGCYVIEWLHMYSVYYICILCTYTRTIHVYNIYIYSTHHLYSK